MRQDQRIQIIIFAIKRFTDIWEEMRNSRDV